jgi:hypothetical protein
LLGDGRRAADAQHHGETDAQENVAHDRSLNDCLHDRVLPTWFLIFVVLAPATSHARRAHQ